MNNGDKIEFYYVSEWHNGFYVGEFPPDPAIVVVATKTNIFMAGKDEVRERPKRTVKPLKELVNILIDSGYLPNEEGAWMKRGYLGFNPAMFEFCGKKPATQFAWEPKWLEVESKIPAKDKPVMVKNSENSSWEMRHSTGELDSAGQLFCFNIGTNSLTATGRTAWKFWREPTPEETSK